MVSVLAFMWISKEDDERRAYPDSIRFFAKVTFIFLPACYLFVVVPTIHLFFGSFWEGGGSIFIDFLQNLFLYWYHAIIISIYSAFFLLLVRNTITGRMVVWKDVSSEAVECFKPLFLLDLVLLSPSFLAGIINLSTYSFSLNSLRFTYTMRILPILYVALIFAPMAVVTGETCLKKAVRKNFQVWRRFSKQTVTMVAVCFIPFLAVAVTAYVLSPLVPRFSVINIIIFYVLDIFYVALSAVAFFFLMVFYLDATEK